MKFAPKPENDFAEYWQTYYDECCQRFDGIQGIAAKWMFRDLIPGMSDFDTRFICRDGMTADDWCRMSVAVGEAHLALCERYPCWARNLEHLPGVNLTWDELASEASYYPEYKQWTYYHSERPDRLRQALAAFDRRPWDDKDEYFHLKKFCLYYGRYDRKIDQPVNLGVHGNKYPLHSRIMHYFSPPVMSAVCLIEKRSFAGKFDTFEIARHHFPDLACWEMIEEILHAGYEIPRFYDEPLLSEFEDTLEAALTEMAARLRESIALVSESAGRDVAEWKKELAGAPIDPALIIFENAKFARLFRGRMLFYANAPERFDVTLLIANELGRIGRNFFRVPFSTYWKMRTGEDNADPVAILNSLRGDLLTDAEIEATKEFARLTPGTWEPGTERQLAAAIADVFDGFFAALYRISKPAA